MFEDIAKIFIFGVGVISALGASVLLITCLFSLMKNRLGDWFRDVVVIVFKKDKFHGDRLFFYSAFLVFMAGVSWSVDYGLEWVGLACIAELLARAWFVNLGVQWRSLGYGTDRL